MSQFTDNIGPSVAVEVNGVEVLSYSEAAARDAARVEKNRFVLAKKLTIDAYPGQPVYWEGGRGDMSGEESVGFFESIDSVLDECERKDVELPAYVWGCYREDLKLDAESILQDALEYQEMEVSISIEQGRELEVLLEGWLQKHGFHIWRADYTTAVLMKPEESE